MKKIRVNVLISAILLILLSLCAILLDMREQVVEIPDDTGTVADTDAEDEDNDSHILESAYAYACQIKSAGNTRTVGILSVSLTQDMKLYEYIPTYSELSDVNAMLENYSDDSIICEITLWKDVTDNFTGENERLTYVRENYEAQEEVSGYTGGYFERKACPALSLYMGYIIENAEGVFFVRDSLGNKLFEVSDMPAVANTRDRNGLPLFIDEDGKYYSVGNDGFVLSDYDDAFETRGLYFDYPSGYGISESRISIVSKRTEDGIRFAYTENGNEITGYAYEKAFGFFDGRAVAKTHSGGYSVISEDGNTVVTGMRYYTNSDLRRVKMTYSAPTLPNIYSLGFYYFDDGLVRQRQIDTDFENGNVTLDKEILMYADGSEFEIPSGYRLVSYSYGVLLLQSENTGLYGMFSNDGDWIAQPIFDYAYPFVCGVAVLGFDGGYAGAIDTKGNVVVDFAYDYVSNCSSGLMLAYRSDIGWSLLCISDGKNV